MPERCPKGHLLDFWAEELAPLTLVCDERFDQTRWLVPRPHRVTHPGIAAYRRIWEPGLW